MRALQSEFWMFCNFLNSKSVSDTNRELQYSNLLLTKAFARRMDVSGLRGYEFYKGLWYGLQLTHGPRGTISVKTPQSVEGVYIFAPYVFI